MTVDDAHCYDIAFRASGYGLGDRGITLSIGICRFGSSASRRDGRMWPMGSCGNLRCYILSFVELGDTGIESVRRLGSVECSTLLWLSVLCR